MVQFENTNVKIELLNNSKIIKVTWSGFLPDDVYRDGLNKALEIAKRHKISDWITDARGVKVVKVENQNWAMNDWMPRAVAAGCYRRQAVVLPEDVFGKASANRMISEVGNMQVEFINFSSEKDAVEYLKNPPTPSKAA